MAQKTAAEHYGGEIRFKRQGPAERFHCDHRLDRATGRAAVTLGEGQPQQPELGVLRPQFAAPALRVLAVGLALLERVTIAEQAIETLLEKPLFLAEVKIHRLQSQDRLGDDVLLNLVGAAINCSLAPVEISRRDRPSPFGAYRRLVPALVVLALGLVRHRIRADDLEQQFRRRLLNFRALDLQNRRSRVGLVVGAMTLGGDDAQLRHFQSFQFDLDGSELLAEALVFTQRLVAGAPHRGQFLDAPDALFREADARDPGALASEQVLGVIPALVLLAD